MKNCLCIILGGGLGAVLRYLVTHMLNRYLNLEHWATFWVNITGCFLIGILGEIFINFNSPMTMFLIVGFVGSYTTFSTFEYENISLIAKEKYIEFLRYSIFSCLFGFIAVACGFQLAQIICK